MKHSIRDSAGRAQRVKPRSSRGRRGRPGRAPLDRIRLVLKRLARFARPLAGVAALIVLLIAYNKVTGSELFALRHVYVTGASQSLQPQVEQAVRKYVASTKLMEVSLTGLRRQIEQTPRVRSARVMRALPDALRVDVVERTPAVLVRRESGPEAGALVWLDSDAMEIGDLSSVGLTSGIPAVATGFGEGARSEAVVAEDKERISVYKSIEEEFSSGSSPIWNLIDEIDLSFPKDVNIHLARPSVRVHIGSQDFLNRTETALKVLDAVMHGQSELLGRFRVQDAAALIKNASHINFIDTARPDRVVINFAAPASARQTAQDSQANKPAGKKK